MREKDGWGQDTGGCMYERRMDGVRGLQCVCMIDG